MVIRRIREHVTTHNWFAVAVDLGIVVAGVFLGTMATNWNQARIDRADAAEYRKQIIGNLRSNEADVAARAAYYGQVRLHAVAALMALQRADRPKGEQFLVDSYQASQQWARPFERTAYDELVNSGLARKVGDERIRAELSSYYVGASGFNLVGTGATAYRERLRRAMDLRVQEAMRGYCDDIVRTLPGGGQVPRLPETCRLGLDPNLAARAANRLAAMPEMEQDLTRLVGDIDQKLLLFGRTSRNATRLRVRLEAI